MSSISTHVIDTSLGRPAAEVPVMLERVDEASNELRNIRVGAGMTDPDGRLGDFLVAGAVLARGTYRLRFDVGEYFARTGRESLYPEVVVLFRVGADKQHYHIPLLLSPFGYSTYRGA